jgi:hypothetical protein
MARFVVTEIRDQYSSAPEVFIVDTRLTSSDDRPSAYVKPMGQIDPNQVAAALNFWWDANS